jgi:hypothetical protein
MPDWGPEFQQHRVNIGAQGQIRKAGRKEEREKEEKER